MFQTIAINQVKDALDQFNKVISTGMMIDLEIFLFLQGSKIFVQ